MAKVSLRIYDREIESLIDQGHLDEAVAHCRHILKTFPKHLETYRLLGKTYLEARRYEEAVDIFNRVLMAVPDDFVSHVGMSIIRDEENKLDDAIWHMERAFEAQPSNAAIQAEMQRLYGRRDGVEPPKIRMTRGALAHMYMQGELYPQAISEIRTVLSEDPQRADMQVLLARAYFRSGQKADASDVCAQLLKRYPYCFDANRIMVELLPASERGESTQVHRHRVNELDPYAVFTRESVFNSSEVSDASINLDRLEYSGEEVEMGQDWSASLGIGLASASTSQEQPEWLKSGLSDEETAVEPEPASSADLEPALGSKSDSDIPDFLRQAGWTESSGAGELASAFPSTEEEPLAPADIPDWLKEQMPAEPSVSSERETVPPDETSDWLSSLGSEQPAEPTSSEIPDWLSGLAGEKPAEPLPASTEIPDWLSGLSPEEATETAKSSEVPDWLSGLGAEKPAEPGIAPVEQEVPDWLTSSSVQEEPEAEPETELPTPPPMSVESLGTSSKEQDEGVAWLEMLAAKHGAKPEELVTDPAARSETPPEWVEQARALAESESSVEPVEEKPSLDETGVWLRDLSEKEPVPAETQEEPLMEETGIPEWLREQFPPEPAPSSEQPTAPTAEAPDLVRDLGPQPAEETAQVETPAEELPAETEVPAWLSEVKTESAEAEEAPAAVEGELPDWLSGLQEKPVQEEPQQQAVSEWLDTLDREESRIDEEPVAKDAETPDWLSELDQIATETEVEQEAEQPSELPLPQMVETEEALDQTVPSETMQEEPAPATPMASTDLPEWLRGLDQPETEERAEAEREEMPPWLKGGFEEEEPHPAPTSAEDWHPVEHREELPASEPEPEFEPEEPAPRPVSPLSEPAFTPPPPDVHMPVTPPAVTIQKTPKPARARQAEPPQADVATLSTAQDELNRGDIPAALGHYNKLIRKGKHLEEAIHALRDSLYRYPVEVGIWQTLGDAYMRANHLQEALDAYNKAEELLR